MNIIIASYLLVILLAIFGGLGIALENRILLSGAKIVAAILIVLIAIQLIALI